jgi:FkbM family methyltransferase
MFNALLNLQSKACRACELLIYRAQLAFHARQCVVDGFKLLLPSHVLSTRMAHRLLQGGIDGEDRRLLARYAKPGDFVLNAGGGCGLSAMAAWRQVRPGGTVVVAEPDPLLHDLARRNFELNGMQEIRSHNAAVVADRQTKEVTFYRKKNYYGSNLLHTDAEGQAIRVPAVYPPDLIEPTCPGRKIFLCDVEGYETTLLAQQDVVDCFDLIITELHFGIHPQDRVSPLVGMFDLLFSRGFKIIDVDDEGFVFERKPAC